MFTGRKSDTFEIRDLRLYFGFGTSDSGSSLKGPGEERSLGHARGQDEAEPELLQQPGLTNRGEAALVHGDHMQGDITEMR